MRLISTLVIMIATTVFRSGLGADWPQFLGAERNSTSAEKDLLRTWPANGPEVLWSVQVGRGFGGPVVKDGKVCLLDRDDEVGDKLRCFQLSDGRELWSYAYDAPGAVMFPGSRSVPTLDGDRVYTCGHNGDLHCIDSNTHKPIWKVNVWTDFGGKAASTSSSGFRSREPGSFPIWAITQCPLIYGDLLIIGSQAPDAGVVAYDKLSGDVSWVDMNLARR